MCLAPVFLAESVSMAGDSLRRCMRGGSIGIEGALLLCQNVGEEATSPLWMGCSYIGGDGHGDFALSGLNLCSPFRLGMFFMFCLPSFGASHL